jgi:nucleoside-diphosphate-sugar epimerase
MSAGNEARLDQAKILIAGCGDLGIRLTHRLGALATTDVIGLRRTPDATLAMPANFQWVTGDLTQESTLNHLPQDFTHIVFAAAPNARTPTDYEAVYLYGLQHVIRACASPALKRIVFISSTAVYSDHGNQWVDETTPTAPTHFNGKTLCAAEQWLQEFGVDHHVETLSLRLSGIYGPGRNFLLDRLRLGQASAPQTEAHWANRIHVEDAAAAIAHLLALSHPDSTYLITDSTPLPMRTLYEALAKLVGGPCPPVGPAPAMVGSKRLSNKRLLATGFALRWPDSREGYAASLTKQDN